MWRSCNELSQADKNKHNKEAKETNKVWGEKNERERRERVANVLGFEKDKSKVNSEASTNKSQISISKSQKM